MTQKNLILAFLLLTMTLSCADKREKEKWIWESEIYAPILLQEGDSINHFEVTDTFKSGEHFKAKLFKQFKNIPNSNGRDMIKEFKGYSFNLLMKLDKDPMYLDSWESMDKYITSIGDTAFISIPIDSVIKYSDSVVHWTAGYRHIFYKDNADTTYSIGGKWVLKN